MQEEKRDRNGHVLPKMELPAELQVILTFKKQNESPA